MRTALSEINEKKPIIEVKKSITIRDAIHWAAEAWLDVSTYTIYASWNNILPPDNQWSEEVPQSTTSEDEDFPLSVWLDSCYDEPDPGLMVMNDEEILAFCKEEVVPKEEPYEEIIPIPNILPISEAYIILQDVLPTLENDSNSTKEELVVFRNVLSRWRDQSN